MKRTFICALHIIDSQNFLRAIVIKQIYKQICFANIPLVHCFFIRHPVPFFSIRLCTSLRIHLVTDIHIWKWHQEAASSHFHRIPLSAHHHSCNGQHGVPADWIDQQPFFQPVFLFRCFQFQIIRFRCIQIADSLCSIISCILSFNACVCFVRSSICSCSPRNKWTNNSLSSLFSCSSVYLNAITGTPVLKLVLIITDFAYYR